ncbi:MAG: DUF4198 domain-containing protein [Thermodesulfobacteria bacterium]|nr:DUF4198 domain-containing protein [Thermodesulfobacteriota bacterium]
MKNAGLKVWITTIIAWCFFLISKGYAHFLWLNVSDYTPRIGEKVVITFGWGHKFPETPKPPRKALIEKVKLFVIEPDGTRKNLRVFYKHGKPQPIKLVVTKKGVYAVIALVKRYVSKTTEGYFYKPRDELKDKEVIYSKWAETTAIAWISVGNSKKVKISSIPMSNFYLLPLTNPSVLNKGEVFKVKVVFKNKPVSAWIYATYAGFSKFKDTYAWTTRSRNRGIAYIKILKKGVPWLLRAEKTEPYPNPNKADKAVYRCTLTFGF